MSAKHLQFPHDIVPLAPAVNAELLQHFHGERTGFVQVGPERYFFPQSYQQQAEAYYNFKARADDIWVATVPRSGTTWTQELVWLVANNLDFDAARQRLLTERFPFLEFSLFMHADVKAELLQQQSHDAKKCHFIEHVSKPGYELLAQMAPTSRRFIKTHFPFSLLPPSIMQQQCKLIYVAREPKSVAVSYYHLNRLYRTQGYVGNFARYWQYFEQGLNPWLPYYSHLKEALAQRQRPNVLFLQYEDMCKDLRVTIEKVAKFLNVELSNEGTENLINHLSITNFRRNSAVNGHEMAAVGILNDGEQSFVRQGAVTALQQEFADDPELLARANAWIAANEREIKNLN